MKIKENIYYVGVNDKDIDLFEGQYQVPNGMAYNSYIIMDKKIAVFDTVDERFYSEWLENIAAVVKDKEPDYLIVQHMEPDHSGSVMQFVTKYPNTKIVASSKAFVMMKNFFGTNFEDKQVVVSKDSTLDLGCHKLIFVEAPMVHWPEVIMTYETTQKVLFSADAFGKFGSLDTDEEWACEARRYYFGIVGNMVYLFKTYLKQLLTLTFKQSAHYTDQYLQKTYLII